MNIVAPSFDPVVAWGIGALAWIVAVAWAWLFGRGKRNPTAALGGAALALLAVTFAAARSGLLQRLDLMPQPLMVLIAGSLVGALALGLSPFGRACARDIPLLSLVAFQTFRFPLELVMHRAAVLGIMPPELSYSGYNFDIVTGAGAVLLSLAMVRGTAPRALLWAWNLWGCACLVVIAAIAAAVSPMLRLFGDGVHVGTWVMFAPYAWLPVFLVPAAVFGHVVLTRALLSGRRR